MLLARDRTGNTGPRSWQYGPSAARSIQKQPRANIPLCNNPSFTQVNFWHDVREFPAYDDASSKNPVELK